MPEEPFADGLKHLPDTQCPAEGVVPGVKRLIANVQTLPLRRFLIHVFQRRDVCRSFWTMPASAKHHPARPGGLARSEEHTSELQSLMRISYAVFCLKNKTQRNALPD